MGAVIRLDRAIADSHEDSQARGRLWTRADNFGWANFAIELERTLTDVRGCHAPGLQNRLKGAVDVSLVGSIPIHPRQIQQS